MLSMCLSHRGVSVGTKNFPDRPKLTRALEQNNVLLHSQVIWVSELHLRSGETALKKDLQEPLLPRLGKAVQRRESK